MQVTDLVQPFQLDRPNLRGRLVRLGPTVSAIIERHDYPPAVANLLAETLTLAVLLAGMLKYDGIFTLQAKGEGPVSLLVADVSHTGALRGYAQFDADAVIALGAAPSAHDLLGDGYIAFTVDQGLSHERYQGIVEMKGEKLADFVQAYFRQSEQIDTAITVTARYQPALGWQAAGLMLQRLPEQADKLVGLDEEDDWRRAMMLMSTATPEELNSPALSPHDLLFRLFHEEEVRVYEPSEIIDRCRCSRERVEGVLGTLPDDDIDEITRDGPAEVRCEFCSRTYRFTADEILSVKQRARQPDTEDIQTEILSEDDTANQDSGFPDKKPPSGSLH